LLLTATPELTSALPFLSDTRPQLFDSQLQPERRAVLARSRWRSSRDRNNLFGRWAFTAEAMSVTFAGDGDAKSNCDPRSIRLGLEAFGRSAPKLWFAVTTAT